MTDDEYGELVKLYKLRGDLLGSIGCKNSIYVPLPSGARIDLDIGRNQVAIAIREEDKADFTTLCIRPLEEHEEVFELFIKLIELNKRSNP